MSKHIYDDPKYRAEMRAQLVVSGYTPEQADTTLTELMGELPFDEAEYEYWLKQFRLEILEKHHTAIADKNNKKRYRQCLLQR
ncbi:hypothetical protein NFL39_20380 [Escherichia coli]|nr:hypothetical protein NFL39_20380 [Escherichia coli]